MLCPAYSSSGRLWFIPLDTSQILYAKRTRESLGGLNTRVRALLQRKRLRNGLRGNGQRSHLVESMISKMWEFDKGYIHCRGQHSNMGPWALICMTNLHAMELRQRRLGQTVWAAKYLGPIIH